jgi:hypothetical protein
MIYSDSEENGGTVPETNSIASFVEVTKLIDLICL